MNPGIAAATIQTRVSLPQSILNPGGYWIMRSMNASATPAANGRKLDGIQTQRSSKITGGAIITPALSTIVEPLSPGNPPVQLRSIQTHNLVYGTYIGDGDSSSFKNLIESDPYEGIVPIQKEECFGHVQKRPKKRPMKKEKGFTSLSQGKAERTSHLYAHVIVQNRGKLPSEIHDGLQVLLAHYGGKPPVPSRGDVIVLWPLSNYYSCSPRGD